MLKCERMCSNGSVDGFSVKYSRFEHIRNRRIPNTTSSSGTDGEKEIKQSDTVRTQAQAQPPTHSHGFQAA